MLSQQKKMKKVLFRLKSYSPEGGDGKFQMTQGITQSRDGKGKKMKERIEAVLEKIRPALQADGGDVELVGVNDGVVSVRLTGACGSCPMSTLTLKMGVERAIRQAVPEVKELVAV
jgi:Fe-S cluster biogenesis protein NfuA